MFLLSALSLPVKHPEISSGIPNLPFSSSLHGHPLDLRDQISELHQIYQDAWLTEYAGYCLEVTLFLPDVEYSYWRTNGGPLATSSSKVNYGETRHVLSSMPHE